MICLLYSKVCYLKSGNSAAPARIIAVAGAYDAMTGRRSCRDALPQETVKAEIEKGKGTRFDPVFADIMIKMINEDKNHALHAAVPAPGAEEGRNNRSERRNDMKKRIAAAILLLALALCAASCAEKINDTDVCATGAEIMAQYVPEGAGYIYRLREAGEGEKGYAIDAEEFASYYGDAAESPDFAKIADCFLYIDETAPTKPCEFALIKLADAGYAETLTSFFKARIDLKIENAKSYPDVDTSALKNAVFASKGVYVWYIAVKDSAADIDSFILGKLKG